MNEKPVKSNELPTEENVWLGDLAGFTVEVGYGYEQTLEHRCGWEADIDGPDKYLANVVVKAMEHRKDGCIK